MGWGRRRSTEKAVPKNNRDGQPAHTRASTILGGSAPGRPIGHAGEAQSEEGSTRNRTLLERGGGSNPQQTSKSGVGVWPSASKWVKVLCFVFCVLLNTGMKSSLGVKNVLDAGI